MSIRKELAIKLIFEDFNKFSELTLHQLNHLMNIIRAGEVKIDKDMLLEIEKNEKELDKYEVKITDQVISTITLFNPVASDLRKIMSCYRIADNLESVGDHVWDSVLNINDIGSKHMFQLFNKPLEKMLKIGMEMVKRSVIAFNYSDKEYALWVIEHDKSIEKLNHKLISRLVKKSEMNEKTRKILEAFLSIRKIVSNLERIGGLATNIAEAAVYSFEGVDIRHKHL